jgi:1-deoxy-D-xylulose-5-phosphate reductoisomerase
MRYLSILGSTGSIGKNTLKIAKHLSDQFKVVALAAGSNVAVIEEQIREHQPEYVALNDPEAAKQLRAKFPRLKIGSGLEGLQEAAAYGKADIVVSAMVGTVGILPTIAAIKAKKQVALANKEVLISGGRLIIDLVKQLGVRMIPIDSEHSALFQCLEGNRTADVRRLIITASGGPFRNYPLEKLSQITVEEALGHPTWVMGPKITVDSSTLMNKGLEVIEAHLLFDMPLDQIEVVVHPQSIIHSLVEYQDGSMLAQLSVPNMITPIQYALTYPNRSPGLLAPFDFIKNSTLQFFTPDVQRFRCLELAFQAAKKGGTLPGYMNAANEVLVNRFLNREIGWLDIVSKLERLMEQHHARPVESFEHILDVDGEARQAAKGA